MGNELADGIRAGEREFGRDPAMERGAVKEFFDHVLDCMPLICVAVLGAVAQILRGTWQGWKNFVASIVTAGFGALLVGLAAQDFHLPDGVCYMLAGMIGYSGGSLVDRFLTVTERKIDEKLK